ncbi:MAG: hypothetical protein QME60_08125 [Verrucomicrobiota bacterium]|nr:hypothetical protein [Verrucomicrobiota bacterium]
MGTGRTFHKRPKTRPKKNPSDRRRKQKSQKKRLLALGMSEEAVRRLTSRQVLDLLKRPSEIAGRPAKT